MPRKRYPAEKEYDWLTPLLDTYDRTDKAVKRNLKPHRKNVACGKGCSECCKNADVRINEKEIAGISWYLHEVMRDNKDQVMRQLENFEAGQEECPLLAGNICAVYPVRPLACRTHYVLGRKCQPGEDNIDRLFMHPEGSLHAAAFPMVKLYGYDTVEEQRAAVSSGFLGTVSPQRIHTFDWSQWLMMGLQMRDIMQRR